MESLRIVLGNSSLARYPQGGGHWTVRLQYALGLKSLGHRIFLLARLKSTNHAEEDQRLIQAYFDRLQFYGLHAQSALLLFPHDSEDQNLDDAVCHGCDPSTVREMIEASDLFLNDCLGIRKPMLMMFKRRVLLDLDPGLLQIANECPDFYDHHFFISVGKKIHDDDCQVPTLGLKWHTFHPFVYLPFWNPLPDPGAHAHFSSITHWGWGGSVRFQERKYHTSKRAAYWNYIELPRKTGRSFELAVNLHPDGPDADQSGDRLLFESYGWKFIDPWKVAISPSAYKDYIGQSRAEISCPRPIYKDLRTGWLSDRSVCYLASGRPVLAEDTGFSDSVPTGHGLLTFSNLFQAAEGVAEIDHNYGDHSLKARRLAEDYFDSAKILPRILEYCSG